MQDLSTIRIIAFKLQAEYEDRFWNWMTEAYSPLLITVKEIAEIEYLNIARENPQYPSRLAINHFANRYDMLKLRDNPKYIDIAKDIATWVGRVETIWFPAYELVRSFVNEDAISGRNVKPEEEDVSIMHFEGHVISPDQEKTYDSWLAKWGYGLYFPLLAKLPGLRKYDSYRLIDVALMGPSTVFTTRRPVGYPSYLSILHFDNIAAYDNYAKSIELDGLREAMKLPFPDGLDFKWYVQYQLMKSWRK